MFVAVGGSGTGSVNDDGAASSKHMVSCCSEGSSNNNASEGTFWLRPQILFVIIIVIMIPLPHPPSPSLTAPLIAVWRRIMRIVTATY